MFYCFQYILFVFGFQQFDCHVSKFRSLVYILLRDHEALWIYRVMFFLKFGKFSVIISSTSFFASFFPRRNPITCMFVCLMFFYMSLRFSSFFFQYFFSVFFRVGHFYCSLVEYTDCFICHLKSAVESM